MEKKGVGLMWFSIRLAHQLMPWIWQKQYWMLFKKGVKTGVYHYSNEGVISWYDFAVSIIEHAGIDCKVEPIYSHEFPAKANRPVFSVLDKRKIKTDFDIEVPYWLDSLNDCLKRLNG